MPATVLVSDIMEGFGKHMEDWMATPADRRRMAGVPV
jgi:hypothetical protein